MAEHLTEEEQIETIKQWWSDNWLSIVVPIVLAASIYGGWNYWTSEQAKKASEGADRYSVLTELVSDGAQQALSNEVRVKAKEQANLIIAKHGGSLYADFSTLLLARIAVEESNLALAEQHLNTVVASGANDQIKNTARARLARVLMSQEKYSEALAQVSSTTSLATKPLFAEIRGDIFMAQGEIAAANTAYQEALDTLSQNQSSHRGILQFKLDSTAQITVEKLAAVQVEPATDEAQ